MPRSARAPARLLAAAMSGIALLGCEPVTEPDLVTTRPVLAAAGGPSVSGTDPAYGRQGDTRLDVRILGSGFDQGTTAAWERDGVPDPAVTVHGTRYVSSRELVATISIAPDATLDFYDVAVYTSSRKKGIGMEMFEVTQAESIGTLGGNTLAREVNDLGQVVGYSYSGSQMHAFVWQDGIGMRSLGPGQAYDIDEAGVTIVGRDKVWTWSGSGWTAGVLSGQGSWGRAIASDAAGVGTAIGGSFQVPNGRKGTVERAAKWVLVTGGWVLQSLQLPAGYSSSWAEDINPAGQVVGTVSPSSGARRAAVWEGDGSATLLPTTSGTASYAVAISASGAMVVGISGNVAVFWAREGSGWSAPVPLESAACGSTMTRAVDVNDAGQIVGQSCSGATMWSVSGGRVVAQLPLRGFGSPSDGPQAEGINNVGVIAGAARSLGAIWRY